VRTYTSVPTLTANSARLFTGSFESAIYLLSSICSVPSHTSVLPAINTNFSHHISVGLANGEVITGQNSISHPSISTALEFGTAPTESDEVEEHDRIEDANLPGSLPTLRKQYITFSKADEEELSARIERLWYINPYGQEIRLAANPMVLNALNDAQAIIYSIGSLYTSLGQAIDNPSIRHKILILNSTIDRETGPSSNPYSALDFIAAVAKACEESKGVTGPVDKSKYRNYVTHLIHLQGPGTPGVDKEELKSIGIEAIRVYGRKNKGENFVRYDERGLIQALEVTMGKRDPRVPNRRNTLEVQVR
jgi:hypothetical protein